MRLATLSCVTSALAQTLSSDNCGNADVSFELVHFEQALEFEASRNVCLGLSGDLASIRSSADQVVLTDLLEAADSGAVWIGVEFSGDGDAEDPADYIFLDGFDDISFFGVDQGELPWADDEPDGLLNSETCVEVNENDGEWVAEDCEEERQFVCRIECDLVQDDDEFDTATLLLVALSFFGLNIVTVGFYLYEEATLMKLEKKTNLMETHFKQRMSWREIIPP